MKSRLPFLMFALTVAGCGTLSQGPREIRDQFRGGYHAMFHPETLVQMRDSTLVEGALKVTISDQHWTGLYQKVAQRDGYATWQSIAHPRSSLVFRDGILVSTRGLGDDVLVSEISDLRVGMAGDMRQGQRQYTLSDGEASALNHVFLCDYNTSDGVFVEDCHGAVTRVSNTYQFHENGAPKKSKQWLGPLLGYASIEWP